MLFKLRTIEAHPKLIRPLAAHELDRVSGAGVKLGFAPIGPLAIFDPGGAGDGAVLCGTPPWWGSKPGGTTDG